VRRRLDAELVRRGLAESRGRAVEVIAAGRVLVGGGPTASPARRVAPDEAITLRGESRRYVSRGGAKLEAALAAFDIEPRGLRVLDAGASTGGFTDCLLQRGAAHVVAVDVGRGQLAWSLRTDARVTALERTNVRSLEPEAIGGAVPLAVADLSFISLLTVAPALERCTLPDARLVLLVKPQFEAGRDAVGKGGIVRDPDVHRHVVERVASGLAAAGLPVVAMVASPITGADGNREFLAHVVRGASPADPRHLSAVAGPAAGP
jgi:23S rRNA (cytidine1920-2'-O)/16S rRNA (cytidine1409-2'-O)-methyltransferase